MRVTTDLVVAAGKAAPKEKLLRRKDLSVGQLFRNQPNGRVYMHTGQRTAPPSGVNLKILFNDQEHVVRVHPSFGCNAAGREIIGFQAIIVQGKVADGEDGSVVTYDGNKNVVYVGEASLSLHVEA